MQLAFLVILMGTLVAGMVALSALAVGQRRRRRRLARAAHEMGMNFSSVDPFGLTQRYDAFVLTGAGHSPRAENVIYGRQGGWGVRAYDYRFEAGHGPGRLTRRYCVIVVETGGRLPEAMLWHAADAEAVPLAAQAATSQVGPWLVAAGESSAERLAGAFATFGSEPISIESHDESLMVFAAVRWAPEGLARRIERVVAAVRVVSGGKALAE